MSRLRDAIREARSRFRAGYVSGPHATITRWSLFQKQDPPEPAHRLPFRTRTAEVVFLKAYDLMVKHPELGRDEVLRQAVREAGRPLHDLTPEDLRLLEIGIDAHMNGPPPNVSRTGGGPGSPGGPMRHTGPNVSRAATMERWGIRSKVRQLRELLAHPNAVGTNGMFSGGHSLPYPGTQTWTKKWTWDDTAPNPWEPEPEPDYEKEQPNPWLSLLRRKRSKKARQRASSR